MLTRAHSPDRKAYRSAIRDVILRTFFSLIILAAGYWAPVSYFHKFSMLSLYGPGALAEAAFLLSKLTAFIYAVMALWSIRCAFVALWSPQQK
jgi:hypothetical protein